MEISDLVPCHPRMLPSLPMAAHESSTMVLLPYLVPTKGKVLEHPSMSQTPQAQQS